MNETLWNNLFKYKKEWRIIWVGIFTSISGIMIANILNMFEPHLILMIVVASILWGVGYVISFVGFWRLFVKGNLKRWIALTTFVTPLIPLVYCCLGWWKWKRYCGQV